MDIYEYLQKDHLKVKNLFKQFKKANKQRRIAIFEMIKQEITLHMMSKQETLYKVLEQFNESAPVSQRFIRENSEIKKKIEEVDNTPVTIDEWKTRILQLEKLFEHHISEEENELFSQAKKVLTSDEAWRVKNQMQDYKEKMLEAAG